MGKGKQIYDYEKAKLRWHEICESDLYMPIYHKDWFWNAVCASEKDWKVIVYESKDVLAAFPFQYRKIHEMWRIENPWQVARGGIWIHLLRDVSFEKKMHLYNEITSFMVDNLPIYDYFQVIFLPAYENWSSLSWNGFKSSVNYNYVIKERKPDEVKQNCTKGRRQRITSAEKSYRIGLNEITIDDYWDFFLRSLGDRGRTVSFEKNQFERLINALRLHDAVQIRSAHAEDKLVAVAAHLVDNVSLYHQFCANSHGYNDAPSLLTYDAICYAMSTGRKFDFEGSMIKGVAEYTFSFSPDTEICLAIHDESNKYRRLNGLRNLLK